MKRLRYNEYIGSIEDYGEHWHGKILNIHDLVTYDAKNIRDLYEEFIIAIEDYEATCKEWNREPRFKSLGES